MMMPAAKHGDPQFGIDIHLCMVPPGVPTPLPTPHFSIVFDPFDYLPWIGATVTVMGMKRANAGTGGIAIHIPPGFPFAPKTPDLTDELFMGSATIAADYEPMSHFLHPVLSCQVVGMRSPSRKKPKGGPMSCVLPTVFNLAIPGTVFLGGPPTISISALVMKGIFAGLGKFAKSNLFKRIRQKLFGKLDNGFLKCVILRAEPVNILNGEVSVEQEDFSLPGRLPLQWVRSYGSSNPHIGVCGPGWETLADARLEVDAHDGSVLMFCPQVGPLSFERLPQGEGEVYAELELADGSRLIRQAQDFVVMTKEDRSFHFPRGMVRQGPQGQTIYPIGQVADRCGNALVFEYVNGYPVSIVEASGRRLELRIERDRLTAVTLHDPISGLHHSFVQYQYDETGDLIAAIDALGAPYCFEYDQHHMVRHTDRNGLSFYYAYDTTPEDGWRVIHAWGDGGLYDYHFGYDDVAQQRHITDSLGHTSIVTLDNDGLPVSELDPLGGLTVYEYDDAARTIAVVDPAGRRTDYVYDDHGNLLKLVRPDGIAIAAEFEQDKPVVIVDPNGASWKRRWDDRGLLVEETSPLGAVSRYEYNGHGLLTRVLNPRGARTVLGFDAWGNVSSLTDALGHSVHFVHNAVGNLLSKKDALEHETRFRYDPKGRLTSVSLPSGATLQYAYDAQDNLTLYADENGAKTRLEYFGQGELARRIQPDGHVVHYRYDTEERLIGVQNQRGERYELRRDALGRVIEEIDYWGQSRRYTYDASGYLAASVDPLGGRIDFTSDPVGRIVQKTLIAPNERAEPWIETLKFDGNGNLVEMANPHVKVSRTFDAESRLLVEEQAHAEGQSFQVANAYDAVGNRIRRETQLTDPAREKLNAGSVVDFNFDLRDQVTEVRVNGGEPLRFSRDVLGQLTYEALAPGLEHHLQYTEEGLLAEQRLSHHAVDLFATRYAYDRAGNLTQRSDSQYGMDVFQYDPLGRILLHTDPLGRVHQFLNDPAGDRLRTRVLDPVQQATKTVRQGEEWRREGTFEGTLFRFDRAGNLTLRTDQRTALECVWDTNQRLIASRSNGKLTEYGYDPLGRRLFKETAGQRTWFGWDGETLAADVIADQPREFVYRPETFEPLVMLVQGADGIAQVLNYINDPNGCPTRLLDAQGQEVWAAHYSAWGAIDRLHVCTVDNPLRLQGQYADAETGLSYNRYRYYDQLIGGFISQDPLGLAAGCHLYQFAPNVWGWVDPWGLSECGLKKALRKKLRQIEVLAETAGNKGIRSTLDRRQVVKLGKSFVGDGYSVSRGRNGELWFTSKDGLRMFRAPTEKASDFATTGKQANFHQRNSKNANWFDDNAGSNVHVNVR